MVEVYVLVTGTLPSQERWQQDLLATFMPVYENGKKTNTVQRLIVAPVIPYKIATHKENLPELINRLGLGDYVLKRYPLLDRFAGWFRKLLGLKRVPRPTNPHPCYEPNQVDKAVCVIPIGVKPDLKDKNGNEMV